MQIVFIENVPNNVSYYSGTLIFHWNNEDSEEGNELKFQYHYGNYKSG